MDVTEEIVVIYAELQSGNLTHDEVRQLEIRLEQARKRLDDANETLKRLITQRQTTEDMRW